MRSLSEILLSFKRALFFASAFAFAISASADIYFEDTQSGWALKYEDFKGFRSIAVEDQDVDSDGRVDLIFHFFGSVSGRSPIGLSRDLLEAPSPIFLKIFLQNENGSYEDNTLAILGEDRPSLGGASRQLVKGDFNGYGKADLADAINW